MADIHSSYECLGVQEFILRAAHRLGYQHYYAELEPNQHRFYDQVVDVAGRDFRRASSKLGTPPKNVYYHLSSCRDLEMEVVHCVTPYEHEVHDADSYMQRLHAHNNSIYDVLKNTEESGMLVVGALHVPELKEWLKESGAVVSVICPARDAMQQRASASSPDPRAHLLQQLLDDAEVIFPPDISTDIHSAQEAVATALSSLESVLQLQRLTINGDSPNQRKGYSHS